MNTFIEITGLNQELLIFLAIDITIAIILLGAMRFISGLSAKVNSLMSLPKKITLLLVSVSPVVLPP